MQNIRILGGDVRGRAGSTMVVVALLMAAVAMLSLSFLMVLRTTQKENQGSRESLSALYACEAGLTRAVDDLARGGTGDLGSKNNPIHLGEQQYWVVADEIGDGRTALTAYGRDDRAQMGVELVVQQSSEGFFRWAAFGDEIVHMDSNARADSYDSGDGPYDEGLDGYANPNGDVGSNANVTMDSNSKVWGDASPGPSGTVSQSGNSYIHGATAPLPELIDLPDIIVPTIPLTSATYTGATDLLAGQYRFTLLQLNSSKTATIHGPATIVCDNFKLKSNAKLYIDATNGPVEFFVINDFILNSNSLVRSTESSPLDVAFNLLSDNILDPGVDVNFDEDDLELDSNAKLYGTIYAPSAEISVDSNFELFGALVARRVDLDSNCRIHYDELLATQSAEADGSYETLCWRLISQP